MEAFVEALEQEVADSGLTLGAIAKALADEGITTTKHTVSLWRRGVQRMKPAEVFAIERVLGLRAGRLSSLLGYVPVDARAARSVPEAIDADPRLSAAQREMLKVTYEAFRATT